MPSNSVEPPDRTAEFHNGRLENIIKILLIKENDGE